MTADPADLAAAQALRRHGLSPRKRLGQNFLRDRSYLARIIEAAELNSHDDVLEIGAGTGVLTRALLETAREVWAIELDDSLFGLLQSELGSCPNAHLWHGNVLNFEPSTVFNGPYKLVANIPYYLTGALIRRYLESERPPVISVLMVQREVAERVVALPGKLSLLGVSVQYYASAEIVARVPAGAFFPVPKVDSALLKLVPHSERSVGTAEGFFHVVKAGFSMPRKQLANSLGSGLAMTRDETGSLLAATGIDGTRRAETLSIAEWSALAQAVIARGTRVEL